VAPVAGRTSVDLNADLGEGGGADRELLEVVSSVSVACGFHAGSPLTMVQTARLAAARQVAVGAHPSYADREGFGRRPLTLPPDEMFAIVVYQVGAMAAAAAAAGTQLQFVKPHGALYNQAAVDPAVAEPVVRAVAAASLGLLCPGGSEIQRRAIEAGVPCFSEVFADRAYLPDGTLAGRDLPGAVLHDSQEVARRAVRLVVEGEVVATDGSIIEIAGDSVCLHGDTPGALDLARSVRRAIEDAGISIRPFAARAD
jgi:UPF0271 protein